LATNLVQPTNVIAANETLLTPFGVFTGEEVLFTSYVNNAPAIQTVSTSGQGLLDLGTGGLYLATDGTYVYFVDAGGPKRAFNFGGTPTALASFPATGNPMNVAADATSLYWIQENSGYPYGQPGTGLVAKVPLGGGTPTILATLPADEGGPTGIAIDGTNVYYKTYHYTGVSTGTFGTLWEVPLGGGTPLAIGQADDAREGSIAVNGTGVYWAGGPRTIVHSYK
jgi:hypothetical protein